ncbi:MAG: NAD-dependent epimerase/dehydratase family protein [Pseudomonadota bacterium]
MRILIGGAGGVLAQQLIPVLAGRGHELYGLMREPRDIPGLRRIGTLADLQRLLDGVDCVLNLAKANARRDAHGTDVALPVTLLQAAAAAGAGRFVQFSSIKALADESHAQPLDLDAVPAPTSDYGRRKLATERALREHAALERVELDLLRLPMVFGAPAAGNYALLRSAVARGLPLPAGRDNRRSTLYAGNLTDFVACLLDETPRPGCRLMHLCDPEALSTADFVRALSAALGRPARVIGMSTRWASRLGGVPLLGSVVERLCGSLTLVPGGLGDWQAPYTTEAALRALEAGARPD